MSASIAILARFARIALSLLPWAFALYLHYRFEHGGVWRVEMPFRALISVVILALGMGLSLLLHSLISKR
jgi:hypothetical protein